MADVRQQEKLDEGENNSKPREWIDEMTRANLERFLFIVALIISTTLFVLALNGCISNQSQTPIPVPYNIAGEQPR